MTHHWDEFSKSLAQPVPRRESLRRLGAVFTATVLAPLGTGFARGGPPPKQPDPCKAFCQCRNKKQQNQCLQACKACGNDPGRLSGSCGDYVCCSAGLSSCGSYCADLVNDPYNCGACGYVCDEPGPYEFGACIDGHCEYACAEGAAYCNGFCTFLSWDPNNCGGCGNVCPESAPYCAEGVCTDSAPCPGAQTRCSGVCYDLNNDPNNCGASCATRMVCGQFETCTGGVCVPVDPPSPEF
jgi:hypothetical protein